MEKLPYNKLKKEHPQEAKEFFYEQEAVALLLNSPGREKMLKSIGLTALEIKKIEGIVDKYAKCKISLEKAKPKREDIIKAEDECLKTTFEAHLLELKNIKGKAAALKIAASVIKAEYPSAVVLDDKMLEKLSKAEGVSKKFPEDFLIFDSEKKKVIGLNVVIG